MRAVLGIVSLLLVLAVVGLLAKKQLSATRMTVPALQQQPVPLAVGTDGVAPQAPTSVRAQSQQVQQQYKQAVEGLMQARPMPEDAP